MKRKVCVVTGTRAEYGLLRYLMEEIATSPRLQLQVIATGMHLSPEFGLTYREIEADGFAIDHKVEMLLSSDTAVGIAKATGLGMIGCADALAGLQPDILVVLGDRFEILPAVTAALYARVPVAHIHGGETTAGAFDEALRHAITKLSHLHFVATPEYRRRVIQLGEDPHRVHVVGGLGVDGIHRTRLLTRQELEARLGFRFGTKNLLVTFHPATLEDASAEHQFAELLSALESLDRCVHVIFTRPNADTGGRALFQMLDEFVARHPENFACFTSLGQQCFWSAMSTADGIVGNSSSGILEAPTFKIGTVNIGDRQAGRPVAKTVVNCEPDATSIREAIDRILSDEFVALRTHATNPYGEPGAASRIVAALETVELNPAFCKKIFYDLPGIGTGRPEGREQTYCENLSGGRRTHHEA